jgi:hypothetical protein
MRSLPMVARSAVECECREMTVRMRARLGKIVVHEFERLKCYLAQRSWWKPQN